MFSFDLPYKTFATNVYLQLTDLEDTSFVRTYNAIDLDPDFNNGKVTWQSTFAYFSFIEKELPDFDDYKDRSKFKVVVGIDWETRDDTGSVIDSGYTDTSLNTLGEDKYHTLYLEDLYMDTSFQSTLIKQGETKNDKLDRCLFAFEIISQHARMQEIAQDVFKGFAENVYAESDNLSVTSDDLNVEYNVRKWIK